MKPQAPPPKRLKPARREPASNARRSRGRRWKTGCRQASPEAHPRLSNRRCDGRGLVSPTEEGTPQGGPLSPLLSNLMLDVLDKELEKRGHRFVRYADDCNIYVRSQEAGERVLAGIERFLERRLKLKINKAKSAVAKPSVRKFLGFSFTGGSEPPRRRIAPQALAASRPRFGSLRDAHAAEASRRLPRSCRPT